MVASAFLALALPGVASASVSVSPLTSTNGSYTVTWTDASGGTTRAYLVERKDGGTPVKTLVTGTYSRAFTAKSVGSYAYQVEIYLWEPEISTYLLSYKTNTATVVVTTLSVPGAPGAITGPATSSTGSYSIAWGAASGSPSRYELLENGAVAYSGTALSASLSGRQNGSYSYQARACNTAGCGPSTAALVVTVELLLTDTVADSVVGDPVVPAQGWVGTAPGTPSTDGGAATYTLPIAAPPGRAGMEPHLAISYGSRSGSGVLGVGWSLSGANSIYRCPRTLAHDGGNRPVRLDDNDRLCMDGQRLVLTGASTYGASGSVYRAEIDTFDRVTLFGAMSAAGSYFEVEHKSGLVSRFQAQSGLANPEVWRLVHERDRQDNCVRYEYGLHGTPRNSGQDQEWVLARIVYTGTMSGAQCTTGSDARRVDFQYGDRPDRRTTYQWGRASVATARLDGIVTWVGAQAVRRYQFGYTASPSTARSLLTSVTLCAALADGTCNVNESLPATTFEYHAQAPTFTTEALLSPTEMSEEKRVKVTGDYDGDGTPDRLVSGPLSNGMVPPPIVPERIELSCFGTPAITAPVDQSTERPVPVWAASFDANYDGKADVAGPHNGKVAFGALGCRPPLPGEPGPVVTLGWSDTNLPWPSVGGAGPGDANGDGLVDVHVAGGAHLRRSPASLTTFDSTATPIAQPATSAYFVFERDVNGDGLPDGFYDKTQLQPAVAFRGWDAVNGYTGSLSNASLKELGQLGGPSGAFATAPGRLWLDVNGDGLPDVYDGTTVYVNRGGVPGYGVLQAASASSAEPAITGGMHRGKAFVMDVDGDGRDEIVVPSHRVVNESPRPPQAYAFCASAMFGQVWETYCDDEIDYAPMSLPDRSIFRWKAYRFQENTDGSFQLIPVTGFDLVAPAGASGASDYSGDGLPDVQYLLHNTYDYSTNPRRKLSGYPANTPLGPYGVKSQWPAPDLLVRARNGMGAEARWAHQPLSQGTPPVGCDPGVRFYSANHAQRTDGNVFFTSSMWAAARMEVSNGVGGLNATCYRYEDAMLNALGRGFQGFKAIVAEERLAPAGGEAAGAGTGCGTAGSSACSVNNLRTRTEFHQEFPLTNRVKRVTVTRGQDGAGIAPISETTYSWCAPATTLPTYTPAANTASWSCFPPGLPAASNAMAPGVWVVYPSATVAKKYDLGAASGSAPLVTATTIAEIDLTSGEADRQCAVVDDTTAPTGGRVTLSWEDRRPLVNDTGAWWLGRVDQRKVVKDFLGAFSLGGLPATCPTSDPSAAAKAQRTSYTWHAATAGRGFRRKLQTETLFAGLVSTAEETTTTYPASTGYDPWGNTARREVTVRDVADLAGTVGAPKTLVTAYAASADGYFLQVERRCTESATCFASSNPTAHISSSVTDPRTGLPTYSQAIQGGPATTTQYDSLGRALTVTSDGAKAAHQRLLACGYLSTPSIGLPGCQGQEAIGRATYQAGAPRRVDYLDVLGRVVRSLGEGMNGAWVVNSEVVLSERGLEWKTYAPRWLGQAAYETRLGGFDALGRVTHKEVDRVPGIFAAGRGDATLKTDYAHAGFRTSITVAKPAAQGGSLTMSRTYDARGKLAETTQRLGGAGSNEAVAQYLYDPAGALTNIRSGSRLANGTWAIDPTSIDLAATYDDLGRKKQVTDPDRGTWRYTWDGVGRLRFQADARDNVTEQRYDGVGRLRERIATANGQAPIDDVWTWDDPNIGQVGVLNRVDGVSDGYSRSYKYDSLRRPYKVTTTLPEADVVATSSRSFTVEYGYDRGTGWLKARTYPNLGSQGGERVVLDYNDRGFLLGETELLASGARGKTYRRAQSMNARGQVLLQDMGNGVAETAGYDASTGLMLDVQAARSTGALIRSTHYQYDHFLNLAIQEKTIPPASPTKATETFTYDDLQRLRSATRAWTGLTGESPASDTYEYDDLGNIMLKSDYSRVRTPAKPGSPYIYGTSARTTRNAGPHAVAQVDKLDGSTAIFSYDRSGNLVEGDGRRIDFDLMDRPVRACSGTPAECAPGASAVVPVTEFSYAPDGGRYRQRVTGSASAGFGPKTVYYLDKDYELTVWADGTMEDRSYLGPTAVVYRKTQGTTTTREVRYQHLDRLGSVDAVTRDDATATLVSVDVHGFDPWGKPRGETWTSSGARLHPSGDQPSQAVTTDRGFTGHEHLDVHYLIHMNGRVYDYRLGRFLSVDPIIGDPANPQSVNPYSYIGNNPLSGTDPTGYMAGATTGSNVVGAVPIGNLWINGSPLSNSAIAAYQEFRAWLGGGAKGEPAASNGGGGGQGSKPNDADAKDAEGPQASSKRGPNETGNSTSKFQLGLAAAAGFAKGVLPFGSLLPTPSTDDPDVLTYFAFGEAAGAGVQAGRASGEATSGGALILVGAGTGGTTAVPGGGLSALGLLEAAEAVVKVDDAIKTLDRAKEMRGKGDGGGGGEKPGPTAEPTPTTHPEQFSRVRGTTAKVHQESGEVWVKDRLHKDHYEVYRNRKDFENGRRSRDVWLDGTPKGKL